MIVETKRRRKILWQIFPSFLFITALSLTAVTWYSTAVFKSFFLNNTEKDLTIRAEFIKRELVSRYSTLFENISSENIELNPDDMVLKKSGISEGIYEDEIYEIDKLCKEIGRISGTRITIILPSGKVIGDSIANIKTMENHNNRYEINLAMNGKKGFSIRQSKTVGYNMMYIALPVTKGTPENNNANEILQHQNPILQVYANENNNISKIDNDFLPAKYPILWILRVAISISSIENRISSIQKNIIIALIVTVVSAAWASLIVARRITRPIEDLQIAANHFANGNLNKSLPFPESEELFQLSLSMNKMAQNLDEKIRTSEDRSMELEAIHSSMKEGVIAVDPSEIIITANNAAASMFGYTSKMIKGRNIHEISRHYELHKLIRKALSNPESVEEDIAINRTDDLVYNVHSTALCNSSGIRIGTLIIFHDITRIRKLETMHKDFAANVSHELKTPLTSIKGFAETLENLIREQRVDQQNTQNSEQNMEKDFKNEQSIKFLKIIEKNVDRLIAIVNDLLALSRVEREEGSIVRLESHDIHHVVQRAIDACSLVSKNKNITIEYHSPSNIMLDSSSTKEVKLHNSLIALIDPILMEQAVVNLLDNAVKYSFAGNKVIVTCEKVDNSIVLSITDYGTGIGKEHLTRIFHRFYRVDKARSRDMGGTGLGLAIVKHIVRYHKGDISVTSTLGKGSTFKITLPSVS